MTAIRLADGLDPRHQSAVSQALVIVQAWVFDLQTQLDAARREIRPSRSNATFLKTLGCSPNLRSRNTYGPLGNELVYLKHWLVLPPR
jgi:hypothetical protein